MSRWAVVSAAAVFVAGVALTGVTAPSPAAADTAYRYWSYWHWDAPTSDWQYSSWGAAAWKPKDATVEGWRFGSQKSGIPPRVTGDYTALCGDAAGGTGKHVAVVIDYGDAAGAPAPRTVCLTGLASNSSGMDALAKAARGIRQDRSGMICAIDNYPNPPDCGSVVSAPATSAPPATTTASPSQTPPPTVTPSAAASTPAATPTSSQSTTTAPVPTQAQQPTEDPAEDSAEDSGTTATTEPAIGAIGSTSPRPAGSADEPSGGGVPVAPIAGAALVVTLAGAAWWRGHRSR